MIPFGSGGISSDQESAVMCSRRARLNGVELVACRLLDTDHRCGSANQFTFDTASSFIARTSAAIPVSSVAHRQGGFLRPRAQLPRYVWYISTGGEGMAMLRHPIDRARSRQWHERSGTTAAGTPQDSTILPHQEIGLGVGRQKHSSGIGTSTPSVSMPTLMVWLAARNLARTSDARCPDHRCDTSTLTPFSAKSRPGCRREAISTAKEGLAPLF